MANELKNQIVVLEPCTKNVEDLLKVIQDRKQAEVVRVSIPEEATQLVRQFQPCMLVVCLHENGELPQRVTLLKNLESSIKYGLLKTLFVSKVKNKQMGALIASLGVTDFMEEPVPLRTLQFKANLQLKAVETIRKQQDAKKASQEKIVFKKAGQKEGEAAGDPAAKPTPALQLEEDTFLFKNSGVKKNGKKFTVELEGPDPKSGEWVSHEDQGNAQAAWRWVPEEEKGTPEADRGDGWVHAGDKPQFQEANKKWQMTSEKPDLSFQKNGKKVAKKIGVNAAGEVTVAADSAKAEENIKKAKTAAERVTQKKAEEKQKIAAAKAAAVAERKLDPKAPYEEKAAPEHRQKIGSEEGVESAPENELDPKATPEEKSAEFNNRLKSDAPEAPAAEKELDPKEKPAEKKKAMSPLDFLKQKKEKQEKGADPKMAAEEKSPEINDRQGSKKEEAPAEAESLDPRAGFEEEKTAPKKRNRAREALDNLKSRLGDDLPDSPEEEPAPFNDQTGAGVEASAEADEPSSDPKRNEEEAPAEFNDRREDSPQLVEKKRKEKFRAEESAAPKVSAKEKKKKVLKEMQDLLGQPIPDSLPPEEEDRLREKFQAEGEPKLSPAELARKERSAKIKALKDSLLDLDLPSAAEEAPRVTAHDTRPDEAENTWSQGAGLNEKKSKMRAFDSDLAEEEEKSAKRGSRREEKEARERAEAANQYFYMPEAELQPSGSAWERAEEHMVYLTGNIRYHGFKMLQELLPLWIYRGDEVPELLDKTKQWKFRGSLPFQAKTLKEVPDDVREFLISLKKEEGAEEKPELETESRAEKERSEAESGESPAAKERKESDFAEAAAEERKEAEPEEEAPQVSGKKKGADHQAGTLEELFQKPRDKKEKPQETLADVLGETSKSPAMEAFLERRKKKNRSETDAPTVSKSEPTNPYLGIFVALSNSFGPAKDQYRPVARVLKAIEMSFGRCSCRILGRPEEDGLASVKVSSSGPVSGERLPADGAIPLKRSGDNEIIGYLLVAPTDGRENFSRQEEEVLAKVAHSLWTALARDEERNAA